MMQPANQQWRYLNPFAAFHASFRCSHAAKSFSSSSSNHTHTHTSLILKLLTEKHIPPHYIL